MGPDRRKPCVAVMHSPLSREVEDRDSGNLFCSLAGHLRNLPDRDTAMAACLLKTFCTRLENSLANDSAGCNSVTRAMTQAKSWFDFRRSGMRRLWSLVCLVLFVGLQFAVVSVQLHEAIHADSQHPDHTCVIKLLSEGQVEASDPVVSVPQATLALVVEPVHEPVILSPVEFLLPPGRAPPVV